MNAHSRLDDMLIAQVSPNERRIRFLTEAEKYFQVNHNKRFDTVYGIELLTLDGFKKLQTSKSSIFTALEVVAHSMGHLTRGTMGSMMEAVGLDQQDAHRIGCACLGQTVYGAVIAERIRNRIRALQS